MADSEKPEALHRQDAAVREQRKASWREKVAVCLLQLYATLDTSTLRTLEPRSWGAVGTSRRKREDSTGE